MLKTANNVKNINNVFIISPSADEIVSNVLQTDIIYYVLVVSEYIGS